MNPFDRRQSGRLRRSLNVLRDHTTETRARARYWLAKSMPYAFAAALAASYFSGNVRGSNVAAQVSTNTHALRCWGILAEAPPGQKAPYGMPPPITAPCPPPGTPVGPPPALAGGP